MAANKPAEGEGEIFSSRTFCLITGASKGLGKGIALKFASKFPPDSLMLLIARNEEQLKETRKSISENNPKIRVTVKSVDLTNPQPKLFDLVITEALNEHNVKPELFQQAMIVHNAGSLGNIKKLTTEMEDAVECREYFDLNLSSVICLNTKFLKTFPQHVVKRRVIINITSLASFHPFKSWGFYCTGKAARDMFFRVMAAEEPSLRILSYAPGPLKTDMTIKAREESADEDIKKWMRDAYAEGKMLTVEFTVNRLVEILEWNKFKNGDHIDVEDELESKAVISP